MKRSVLLSVGIVAAVLIVAAAATAREMTYGGIGATVAAFKSSNTMGVGEPPLGLAYYHIDQVRKGRVVAYHFEANFKPPLSARERVSMLVGVNVPDDRVGTSVNGTYCIIVRSRTLKRLTGRAYATAVTSKSAPTVAWMYAQVKPHCG